MNPFKDFFPNYKDNKTYRICAKVYKSGCFKLSAINVP